MATVLAISSEVVRGYVGNSAARCALQGLGHEHWALPSIILSNHPGHAHSAGAPLPPAQLSGMLDALEANGWLDDVDAIMSGYLPTAAHVDVVAACVRKLRAARPVTYLCDPILGDDPKGLYLNQEAAETIRDQLLPLADITTPNRFELAWLSGLDVRGPGDALDAARILEVQTVLATSVPCSEQGKVTNLHLEAGQEAATAKALRIDVQHKAAVPHGTGDLLAALYLGHRLRPTAAVCAFATAISGIAVAIENSAASDELRLISSRAWLEAPPLPTRRLTPDVGNGGE